MMIPNEKAFVFLYPEVDIIDFEIHRAAYYYSDKEREKEYISRIKKAKSKEEKDNIRAEAIKARDLEFKAIYGQVLNSCIDLRYRQTGFMVYYAIFDGSKVSEVIEVKPQDKVIHVCMDAKTHRTKRPDGTYPYPNQDFILNQMGPPKILRIGGFHIWDCVERLAKRAYERGVDTLVDEDLTELFTYRIKQPEFKEGVYPSFNPRSEGEEGYEMFMRVRKDPWWWQKY